MTKSELNKYRIVLEAKQAELVQLVRNREEYGDQIETSMNGLFPVEGIRLVGRKRESSKELPPSTS
jgi:hypothetical protein